MEEQLSDETIASLKHSIEVEIGRIDKKIDYITKLKEEAVEHLVQQREECREREIMGQIDEEIEDIQGRHIAVLARQAQIHRAKKEYNELEEALAEINNELVTIQERHEQVMEELTDKRNFLQERLGSIQMLDEMKIKIDTELEQEIQMHKNDLDRLKMEREELLKRTDLTPSAMEIALRELDNKIEELEKEHIRKLTQLIQASNEIKEAFSKGFSHARKEEILQELEKLKEQAMSATSSELMIIEAKIEELNRELEQLEALIEIQQESEELRFADALEERGLKLTPSGRILTGSGRILTIQDAKESGLLEGRLSALYAREKLTSLLEQRGLTMTPSGRIRMENGEVYTMEEAKKLGLLQGLEEELMKMRGITLSTSGRILTRDGKILSRAEAERLGLLDGIDLDELYGVESESESMTESIATSMSGMSSADVHYLKNVLGRPLALALAEITVKQPTDPIHYLGHWLYKYRYNQELDEMKKKEISDLLEERERWARDALRQQAEADVKVVLEELLELIDEAVERHAIEKELNRIEADTAMINTEEADLESEARDTLGIYDGPTRGQHLI